MHGVSWVQPPSSSGIRGDQILELSPVVDRSDHCLDFRNRRPGKFPIIPQQVQPIAKIAFCCEKSVPVVFVQTAVQLVRSTLGHKRDLSAGGPAARREAKSKHRQKELLESR